MGILTGSANGLAFDLFAQHAGGVLRLACSLGRADRLGTELGNLGVAPVTDAVNLADFQKAEIVKWGKAVKDSGAQVD